MTAFAATDENTRAIGRINGVLRGPVTDIFRQTIPDLRARTRRDAYERIMSSPTMAATCFKEFRAKPEMFQSLLVGPDQQPVTSDEQMLTCGRTLAQVVALVVRAVAKRYFRAKLVITRRAPAAKTKAPGLFAVIFGAFKPPPPPRPVIREYSRADALYQAMRSYLLFDWQVGLIPHYASLPVSVVNQLGPRILEYREVSDVEALVKAAHTPFPETAFHEASTPPVAAAAIAPPASSAPPPAERPQASPLATLPTKTDVLRSVCRRFGLAHLFGIDEASLNRLIDVVNGPGRPAVSTLTHAGLASPEAMVAAVCMARRLGPARLEALMNSRRGESFLVDLGNQVRRSNMPTLESAEEIQRALKGILDPLINSYFRP